MITNIASKQYYVKMLGYGPVTQRKYSQVSRKKSSWPNNALFPISSEQPVMLLIAIRKFLSDFQG